MRAVSPTGLFLRLFRLRAADLLNTNHLQPLSFASGRTEVGLTYGFTRVINGLRGEWYNKSKPQETEQVHTRMNPAVIRLTAFVLEHKLSQYLQKRMPLNQFGLPQ